MADRQLTLYNIPKEVGDPAWLRAVFAVMDNEDKLILSSN